MFAYCLNNPVSMMDEEGDLAITVSVTVYTITTLVLSEGVTIMVIERAYCIYKKGRRIYKRYKTKKINYYNSAVTKAHSKIKKR